MRVTIGSGCGTAWLSITHVWVLGCMTDGWLAIVCVFQLSVNNAGTEGLVRWCVNGVGGCIYRVGGVAFSLLHTFWIR
jgi:hypothetical protein